MPSSVSLNGTVTDDGLPADGTLTSTWSKVTGPGTVTFADPSSASTTATFSAEGIYELQLSGSDSALSAADTVTVTVNNASGTNQPPIVSAGDDQTIIASGAADLQGTVTDDGLPASPGNLTITWSKLTGPGTVTFANASSAQTTATFSTTGVYGLRLSGSDGALTRTDDVTVTVNPAGGGGGPNLVGNAGFETALTGWKASTGALTRVAAARTGGWAGEMRNTGTSSITCQLNDSPNWVTSTTAGSTYTATAWVKGDAAGNGSTVRLRFREYNSAGTNLGSKEASVVLTTGYQQVVLTYTPTAAGSTLDFNVLRGSTPAGALCYDVDDVSIVVN